MKPVNCILLVDDSEADNYFHSLIIREAEVCNYLEIAEDGEEALAYLTTADGQTRQKPDLIFLDINMPRMNGFEFLEDYRKLDEHLKSGTLIMMLTTSINPDDHDRALQFSEVKEYLNKPLLPDTLEEIVRKYF